MRFIIYKNSILATLCSMFGAAFIAMAVASMFSGELEILTGIGVIIGGLGFMWLGDLISTKKAERKRRKAQQATQTANRTAASSAVNSGTSYRGNAQAAPKQTHVQTDNSHFAARNPYAQSAAPMHNGKPVRQSLAFAGIFFLIAMLLALWGLHLYKESTPFFTVNSEQVALFAACPLLAIAAFRTRHTQKVSILFVIGFLLMTLASVDVSLTTYRTYGFGGYTASDGSSYYAMTLSHILKAVSYFLITVFALFSMQKLKNQLGGIVKWLWFIPIPVLLLVYAKEISDSYVLDLIKLAFEDGIRLTPRFDLLEAAANFWVILGVFISGFAFQCFCRNTESYVEPELQYANPAPAQAGNGIVCPHCRQMNDAGSVFCCNCGQRVTQAQPMRKAAPEPIQKPQPKPSANTASVPKNIQKEMEAYKDLLDCGILTQEEYDQKIRELTRG